jgi:hypothetical protein
MNSPFKMKYQGVPALLKKLVGNQDKLPENLQKAIKAAPESEPAVKSYGTKDAAVKKNDPGKKKAKSKTFSPVDSSVIPEGKYAKRRAKSIAKQKKEKRYSMGSGQYEGTYVDTSSGKRYRVGKGPKYQG